MIGTKIKRYLDEHYLKQKILQNALGLSKGTISSILSNKRKLSSEELYMVCAVLNVSADYFKD